MPNNTAQKVNRRRPHNINLVSYLFVLSAITFVTTLAIQMYVTNGLAIKGKEIVQLEQRRTQLEKEISELVLEQSKYSSLKYVEEQAYDLGFSKNDLYAQKIYSAVSKASLSTL